jgi:hypothetical protein
MMNCRCAAYFLQNSLRQFHRAVAAMQLVEPPTDARAFSANCPKGALSVKVSDPMVALVDDHVERILRELAEEMEERLATPADGA